MRTTASVGALLFVALVVVLGAVGALSIHRSMEGTEGQHYFTPSESGVVFYDSNGARVDSATESGGSAQPAAVQSQSTRR